jgi:WD40 repeat protein
MFVNLTKILKKNEEKNIEIINELELNKDDKNNIFIPVKIYINQKDEDDKKKLYVLDNYNGIIKSLKIEQIQKKVNNINNQENNINNKIPKKNIKLVDNKKDIKLFIPKNRINFYNNINIPSVFYNKGHCIALGGFWNGNILIESISEDNKKDKIEKIETKIYSTNEQSSITHILIDPNEIYMLCANNLGTIFVYIIDSKEKSLLHLYKSLYDHYSPISSLAFDDKLNIFITCSKDGFCNLYTTPQCKLVNSFNLKNLVQSENIVYSNISLISSSPLPCFIFYFESRSSLCVCSINGHFIKEQKVDYNIKNNCIKKFTDNQFNDYLLIIDQKDEVINIYNIIDLQIVMTGQIKNYKVIDFIFSKDFDNLFVLVKPKNENENEKEKESYKILIMKNTKMPKINQEDKKISQINNEEVINKE